MHRTLSPLLELPRLLNRRIGFVSAQGRNRFRWIKSRFIRQVVSAQTIHLGMALNVWRDRDAEMFLVTEHKADYSLPLYLMFLLKRRPVFFFVHDMQQVATLTVRCRIALNLCRWWTRLGPFYPLFISLNDSVLEPGSRFPAEKELTIPHPHPLAESRGPGRKPRIPGTRFRVGIISSPRKEKPVERLLDILEAAQKEFGFQLVVGAPLLKFPSRLNHPSIELIDTTTEAQYSQCLASLDIFVVDFVKAEYFFRPSGAVVDAGMNGCYVLCPDYPIFRAQISQPVSIGATFGELEEIPARLKAAMELLETAPPDWQAWRDEHRLEAIAERFRSFMKKRNI